MGFKGSRKGFDRVEGVLKVVPLLVVVEILNSGRSWGRDTLLTLFRVTLFPFQVLCPMGIITSFQMEPELKISRTARFIPGYDADLFIKMADLDGVTLPYHRKALPDVKGILKNDALISCFLGLSLELSVSAFQFFSLSSISVPTFL